MHSQETKQKLIRMVLDDGHLPNNAAHALGISEKTAYAWARAAGWSTSSRQRRDNPRVEWELITPNEDKVNEYHEVMILALASSNHNAILT